MSCETTYAKDLQTLSEANEEIARLARELAQDLAAKSLRARTITIKVRYSDFTTVTRSHTAKSSTASPAEIVNRAQMLLERTEADRRPVRLLGVGAHGFAQDET